MSPGASWELKLCSCPCQELGTQRGCVNAGRGPNVRHRNVSPSEMPPPAGPRNQRVEVRVVRGGWRPRCLFSRAQGQGLLPFSLPLLRCCWQQAGCSADSHGEGISKAKGSSLVPLQGKMRCFTPALSSGNPSPCPASTHRKSWAQPEGPPSVRGENQPCVELSPISIKPTRSSGGQQPVCLFPGLCPLVCVPWSLPQQLCTPAVAAGVLREPPAGPAALPARLAGVLLPGACFGPSQSAAAALCSRCWRLLFS